MNIKEINKIMNNLARETEKFQISVVTCSKFPKSQKNPVKLVKIIDIFRNLEIRGKICRDLAQPLAYRVSIEPQIEISSRAKSIGNFYAIASPG